MQKYEEESYMKVPEGYKRYTGAMLRHTFAREDIDEESGLLHDAMVACNALYRLEFKLNELSAK